MLCLALRFIGVARSPAKPSAALRCGSEAGNACMACNSKVGHRRQKSRREQRGRALSRKQAKHAGPCVKQEDPVLPVQQVHLPRPAPALLEPDAQFCSPHCDHPARCLQQPGTTSGSAVARLFHQWLAPPAHQPDTILHTPSTQLTQLYALT